MVKTEFNTYGITNATALKGIIVQNAGYGVYYEDANINRDRWLMAKNICCGSNGHGKSVINMKKQVKERN